MSVQPGAPGNLPDASAAYQAWDNLFAFCVRMALSTEHGTPAEEKAAWDRFVRGHALSLKERDAALETMLASLKGDANAR